MTFPLPRFAKPGSTAHVVRPPASYTRAGGAFGAAQVLALQPAAWYRFNSGVTVTGSGVSQWNDASGNGRNLTQGTDANRPPLQASGAILFDGAAQFLRTASFTINQPGTVYWLAKQVSWVASEKLFDGFTPGGRWIVQQKAAGASPQLTIFAGTEVATNSDLVIGSYGVVCAVYNGASSVLQINSGTPVTGDAGANNLTGGFTLCADNAAVPTVFANFEVREGIFFSTAHASATRAKIVTYLGRLAGLTL
jgi:hypothetical protein